MNSKQLKQQFKDVYEDFFQKHQIVVSAPFLMNRAGDISKEYSGVTIKQKIPLRLYIGISKTNSKKIQINGISYFEKAENRFVTANILEYAPHFYNLDSYINTERKEILEIYDGINISVLSELPRGMGLGFESILSFLLSTGLNRLLNKVDQKTVEYINDMSIEDALKRTNPDIAKRFTDGIVFDKLIFGTIISSVKKSSLFDSYYPIITISKDYENKEESVMFSLNKGYTFRLDELIGGLRKIPYLPIDYGIIYSGKPVLLEQIINHQKEDFLYLHSIKPEFKKIFGKYFEELKDNMPKFYKNFIINGNDTEENMLYGNLMGILSIKIFYFMLQLYKNEYNEQTIKYFIEALKKFRRGNYATKENSNMFLDIMRKLTEEFKMHHGLFALFPNDTTIMGGTIGFALPLEGFRKNILDSIEQTKKDFTGVDMIYCSRLDGIESKGLMFEQDIDRNLYSEFIDSKKHILKTSTGESFLGTYEELIMDKQHEIILDCINEKIFVKGKKMTSEDLCSQSATIGVLKELIHNIGKEVNNKHLPQSSYGKNKNEMTGKIILPLIKLVEKTIGKKLPLVCKGSTYEFYIKLNHSDINIAMIDTIYEK